MSSLTREWAVTAPNGKTYHATMAAHPESHDRDPLIDTVNEHARDLLADTIGLRRTLHEWPELGNELPITRDRVLFNAGYALPYDKWKFDFTVQWNGKRRIPNLDPGYDHTSYRNMPSDVAPPYVNLNAQITRTWVQWDVYLGGENLGNYRQSNPIIGADDPFGQRFDAGIVWAPVVGRTIYAGIRYKIKR